MHNAPMTTLITLRRRRIHHHSNKIIIIVMFLNRFLNICGCNRLHNRFVSIQTKIIKRIPAVLINALNFLIASISFKPVLINSSTLSGSLLKEILMAYLDFGYLKTLPLYQFEILVLLLLSIL